MEARYVCLSPAVAGVETPEHVQAIFRDRVVNGGAFVGDHDAPNERRDTGTEPTFSRPFEGAFADPRSLCVDISAAGMAKAHELVSSRIERRLLRAL